MRVAVALRGTARQAGATTKIPTATRKAEPARGARPAGEICNDGRAALRPLGLNATTMPRRQADEIMAQAARGLRVRDVPGQ